METVPLVAEEVAPMPTISAEPEFNRIGDLNRSTITDPNMSLTSKALTNVLASSVDNIIELDKTAEIEAAEARKQSTNF